MSNLDYLTTTYGGYMNSHATALVFGAFLGDSLALGPHWIYDTAQIESVFGRIDEPVAPPEGSYHGGKKEGDLTHYGDQSLLLLEHLAAHKGNFHKDNFVQYWQEKMQSYGGYVDRATKETLKNLASGKNAGDCGSSSTDLGGPARIAPLIYTYGDDLDILLQAVSDQTLLTHNGQGVNAGALFIARSCHAILQGTSPRKAFQLALQQDIDDPNLNLRLRQCLELPPDNIQQTIKEFGQTCTISAALPGAVYTILSCENNYEEAIIENVMAGGDSAARGMVIGMILGAALGMEHLPQRWLHKLNAYGHIQQCLQSLPG